jgi:hypothetical protein
MKPYDGADPYSRELAALDQAMACREDSRLRSGASFIDAHRTRRPRTRREFPRPSVTRAAGTGFAERLRSIQREHSPQEAR